MFKNTQEMKVYVKEVLESKNIQKLPKTLKLRMDDFQDAEFFGLAEKMQKYSKAIEKFCESLKANEYKAFPETMKADELPLESLKAKAVIHSRRVRELAELRARLVEKEREVEQSIGKIPFTQREQFNGLLVDAANNRAELESA